MPSLLKLKRWLLCAVVVVGSSSMGEEHLEKTKPEWRIFAKPGSRVAQYVKTDRANPQSLNVFSPAVYGEEFARACDLFLVNKKMCTGSQASLFYQGVLHHDTLVLRLEEKVNGMVEGDEMQNIIRRNLADEDWAKVGENLPGVTGLDTSNEKFPVEVEPYRTQTLYIPLIENRAIMRFAKIRLEGSLHLSVEDGDISCHFVPDL